MRTDRKNGDPAHLKPYLAARQQLIGKGCTAENLDALLMPCLLAPRPTEQTKELDLIKKRFAASIQSLENNVAEIKELSKTPLSAYRGMSLDECLGLRSEFFETAARVQSDAEGLGKIKQIVASALSVRDMCSPAYFIRMFCLYCRAATENKKQATYKEMADFFHAAIDEVTDDTSDRFCPRRKGEPTDPYSERALGIQLERFQRDDPALFRELETLLREYVRSCPAGTPVFTDWALRRNRRIITSTQTKGEEHHDNKT